MVRGLKIPRKIFRKTKACEIGDHAVKENRHEKERQNQHTGRRFFETIPETQIKANQNKNNDSN